jgi:glycosyltransferase involved in cell wall biosynthesis
MARAAGDPVPQAAKIERHTARRALGLDAGGRYLGMIGGLDARKAVSATLAAFRVAGLASTDRFLLAGKLPPEYSKLIRDEYQDLIRNGTLVVLDRFLTDQELALGFAALDVHCSTYTDFSGLSSLMLKSIAAGVPVVVRDQPGWARATVRRFRVGHAADVGNALAFARTLREALEASSSYIEGSAVARLLRFHSIANFTEGLVERAAALAGKAAALASIVSWAWVLEALPPERRYLR